MNNNSQTTARRAKASTQDILGAITRMPAVNARWKKNYENLMALRDDMHKRKDGLVETAKQEQAVFSLHMADAGTDQYDQDFALSMLSTEQSALYEIEEALNRIRNGTYGICEVTGQPIEQERLEAIPWARFSLQAQHELERDGKFERAKFADRATLGGPEATEEEEGDDEE
jgi:DnaK suppressor protein